MPSGGMAQLSGFRIEMYVRRSNELALRVAAKRRIHAGEQQGRISGIPVVVKAIPRNRYGSSW
jgi:hypothetical protein